MASVKRTNLIIIVTLLLFNTVGSSQTMDEIAKMKAQCQSCLDSGVDMQGCARKYCIEMYEIVDTAFNNLSEKLSQQERALLKTEQVKWLKKRKQFEKEEEKEFQKKYKTGEWGTDMFMIVYENDAEYTRKRIVELIKRRNKLINSNQAATTLH